MQYGISHLPHKRRNIVLMEACVCIVEKMVIKSNITILSKWRIQLHQVTHNRKPEKPSHNMDRAARFFIFKKSRFFLSVQPSRCFIIPLHLGSQRLKIFALLDSRASVWFLDEEFMKLHKIPIIKKLNPTHVEVIDKWPLVSGNVIHETIPLEVKFGNHSSSIVFNIIGTPSAPVILKFLS